MFYYAGYKATNFNLNLSNWDTSQVSTMTSMFRYAGYSATDFNLNLSNWNTSQVSTMSNMFSYAGRNATTFLITIPLTNGNGINNNNTRMYGSSATRYANPPTGKSFTLATS